MMYEETERFYSSVSISGRKISFFTKSNRLKILFENTTENFEADICSLQKKPSLIEQFLMDILKNKLSVVDVPRNASNESIF